jgi:hypothetical protein
LEKLDPFRLTENPASRAITCRLLAARHRLPEVGEWLKLA